MEEKTEKQENVASSEADLEMRLDRMRLRFGNAKIRHEEIEVKIRLTHTDTLQSFAEHIQKILNFLERICGSKKITQHFLSTIKVSFDKTSVSISNIFSSQDERFRLFGQEYILSYLGHRLNHRGFNVMECLLRDFAPELFGVQERMPIYSIPEISLSHLTYLDLESVSINSIEPLAFIGSNLTDLSARGTQIFQLNALNKLNCPNLSMFNFKETLISHPSNCSLSRLKTHDIIKFRLQTEGLDRGGWYYRKYFQNYFFPEMIKFEGTLSNLDDRPNYRKLLAISQFQNVGIDIKDEFFKMLCKNEQAAKKEQESTNKTEKSQERGRIN